MTVVARLLSPQVREAALRFFYDAVVFDSRSASQSGEDESPSPQETDISLVKCTPIRKCATFWRVANRQLAVVAAPVVTAPTVRHPRRR